jgi:hypothetical protein
MADAQQSGKGLMGPVPEWLRPSVSFGLAGLGCGSGGYLIYAAIQTIRVHPEMLAQLTSTQVLIFGIAAIFLWIYYKGSIRNSEFQMKNVEIQARNAASSEQLAEAVRKLAEKDDQQAREQDILLNHLATQNQEILDRLLSICREQNKQ